MIISLVWIVSAIYCLTRMYKSYSKKSHDGITGITPGFDTFVFLIGAPLFMVVDLIARWYQRVK